jgi:hypothetical protein
VEQPHPHSPNPAAYSGSDPSLAHPRPPVGELRELFWQNVIREMLTSLSMLSMKLEAQHQAEKIDPGTVIIDTPEGTITQAGPGAADDPEESEPSERDLFDGRLAVITTLGNRIPIADVHPLFACGVTHNSDARSLATAVECTVFQIRTPPGEVFTLPLSEIRGFHSLSPELVEKLQRQAEAQLNHMRGGPDEENQQPFGFAAFTSLAKSSSDQNTDEVDRS